MDNNTSSTKLKQLKRVLIQYPNLEFEQLKDTLLIDNNILLLSLLEKLLSKDINSISYIKYNNDYNYLITCLKHILYIFTNYSKNVGIDELEGLERIRNSIIQKRKENNGKIPNHLKYTYDKLLFIIKPLIDLHDKDNNKKHEKQKNNNSALYKLAEKIIFKYNKFDYFYQIAKIYPDIINCLDSDNIPLIQRIIEKQIRNYKKHCNIEKLLYFESLIKYILQSSAFYLTKVQITSILNYLKAEEDIILNSDEDKEDLNLSVFIDNCFNILKKNSKNITSVKCERELLKKYSIKSADELCTFVNAGNSLLDDNLEDYTDKRIITMDLSSNTKIYDDAVSCEILPNGNYLIGIYIADAASIIKEESNIDLVAYELCENIYLPDKFIGMLPDNLSEYLSLSAGSFKRVLAYMFEFDQKCNMHDFKVKNVVIKVDKNLTFSNAQKLYYVNHNNEQGQILKDLIHFSKSIHDSNFYNTSYHLIKEEKRKLSHKDEYHTNNDCSKSLETLMILVNYSMAKFFSENNYPLLYRVNSSHVDSDMIGTLKNFSTSNYLPNEIIKNIDKLCSKSKYSSFNNGHNGLNLSCYCHNTNPIRSYASLLNQRIIKKEFIEGGLTKEEITKYEMLMPRIASHINSCIKRHECFSDEYVKILTKK